jgi:alpha-glucosidase
MQRPLPAFLLLALLQLSSPALDLVSPDSRVVLRVGVGQDGALLYSVLSDGKVRLEPARMGVTVDRQDLGAGVKLGEPIFRDVFEVFPWRGNNSSATNHCRVYEIPVQPQSGPAWTLEARVFDDGAGFRYRVPGDGERRVQGESTAWQLPKDAVAWLQTDTSSYEGVYHSCEAAEIPVQTVEKGKTNLVFLGPPVTLAHPDGFYTLISEAALFDYSGLTLRSAGQGRLEAAFQDDREGWTHSGPIRSPWRVAVVSRDLNGLVNSDVIAALCDPPDPALFPQGAQTEWIRPGKAPCTWMVYGNDGAQWDKQKWFVDLCAATGCEYLLVDAGWRSERWGWLKNGGDVWARAAELCRYAAERNVGIILWHAYPEGRDDSPGLTTPEKREELLANCARAGVKGVKVDFFNSEGRQVIGAYEDLLRRSAKHRILINFHGAHKPTGEVRTWPNEITREGLREQEYVLWSEMTLNHYGAMPFTRMAVGHGDFLPGYVQNRFLKNTTLMFQMASTIVFSSPFLCWPDNPEAYLHSPMLPFLRSVPVTWDETRILPGSVLGESVVMARRSGTEWYIAVLNCRAASRMFSVDLAPFRSAKHQLNVYRDGSGKGSCLIEKVPAGSGASSVEAELAPGGGLLIHLQTAREFPGWK